MALNSKKVEEILARNMTIPPEGAPCYRKIMDLKGSVDYLVSLTDGPNVGNELENLDRLKTYCHLLNLPEGNAMEEYVMLLKQKTFLDKEISDYYVAQHLPPYGSAAYKEYEKKGNRLQEIKRAIIRQSRFYAEFLATPRDEIDALWGPPSSVIRPKRTLENRLRNLGIETPTLPNSPLENRLGNLGIQTPRPSNRTLNFPSPYKGDIHLPFRKGGKRTKKARKHRRRRTSRS